MMPSETPAAIVTSMATTVSCTVAGSRSRTTRRAGARYWKDWPKSPWATLRRKRPYWTIKGSRSPSCRFSSATADSGAPSGRSIRAGSPGRTRRMMNTSTDTPSSVSADCATRRRI